MSARTQELELSGGPGATVGAERWLREVLSDWHLRPGLARTWLQPATGVLSSGGDLVLHLEHDADLNLVTLEIRAGGAVLFGVDDFLM